MVFDPGDTVFGINNRTQVAVANIFVTKMGDLDLFVLQF